MEELEVLERTVDILIAVEREQPIGIIKLSAMLDIPEHKVRYSLRMLQKEGIIKATPEGGVISPHHENFKEHLREILNEMEEATKRLKDVLRSDL